MWQRHWFRWAIGVIVMTCLTGWIYRGILFPAGGEALFPWASDTLGHLHKADYLQQQLAQGVFYPDLLPDWYMGIQMMRYHPPLPYYLLLGLKVILGDTIAAANGLIALAALFGGLTWLLYQRWIGWGPALVGGGLFLFLPDNLRVALAEGNLPRVLATALLPLAFYCALRILEESGRRWHRLGLIGCFALVVLCHAMMVAIYAVCLTLVAGLAWLTGAAYPRRALTVVGCIVIGMMLSGWWLLPSLTGGITELDSSAMTEALAVFPLSSYFIPTLRQGNPEAIYIGAALLLVSALLLFARRGRKPYTLPLLLTGWFGVLITTTGINALFNALPLHSLLWPLRFLGVSSFMLLLGCVSVMDAWRERSRLLVMVVIGLIGFDQAGSFFLIHLRPVLPDVAAIGQGLAQTQGWREATLDESRLGSAPTYFFSVTGQREQVFGWAYQGARSARSVAALNEAMGLGYGPYLMDRLELFGVDDVVVLNALSDVGGALQAGGYQLAYTGQATRWYHRQGQPRALIANWPALGIGRGAQNLAYLFPTMVIGTSIFIDDYSLEELARYDTLFLSGFHWHDRAAAEALIRQAAESGVNVVADLTGVTDDPLARIPRFLDVWGEKIILNPEPLLVQGEDKSYTLQPFGSADALWYTHTPQGLMTTTLAAHYLGEQVAVLGYNTYSEGRVWFVGLNLPYHAATRRDPVAIEILAGVLGLTSGVENHYETISLEEYTAEQSGYRFAYDLQQPARLFVPVAHHEGLSLWIDDQPAAIIALENLVAFDAPAGKHSVQLQMQPTRIHRLGWFVSGMGFIGLVLLFGLEERVWPVKFSSKLP